MNVTAKKTFAMRVKQTVTIKASGLANGDGIKSWTSNKPGVAAVKNGKITALKAGQAKITVKSGSKKIIFTVVVPKTATKTISGVPAAKVLKKGKTYTISAKVAPANSDYKVTYMSSNTKVATVSAKGKITAIKKGTAVITVKSGSQIKQCKVTVK